jgi:hypothetical protein
MLLGCSRKQGNVSLVKVEVQRAELTEAAQTEWTHRFESGGELV